MAKPKPRIVEAAGSASGSLEQTPEAKALAAKIERAMVAATEECVAAGVRDPDLIREHKLAARAAVKAGKPAPALKVPKGKGKK